MTDESPTCSIGDCDSRSRYLLAPEGDLCPRHAQERHPKVVGWLRATLGDPKEVEA